MRKETKRPFMGLLMGTSGSYYIDILKLINNDYGINTFRWPDLIKNHPSIFTKGLLTRLKDSDWIIISERKNSHSCKWILHPNAMDIINLCETRKTMRMNK